MKSISRVFASSKCLAVSLLERFIIPRGLQYPCSRDLLSLEAFAISLLERFIIPRGFCNILAREIYYP